MIMVASYCGVNGQGGSGKLLCVPAAVFHFDPSVPTYGSKWNQEQKMPELQGFLAFFQTQNPNVRIPGYLFSMKLEQEGTQRKVKPVWQVDVCVALPDDRMFGKGGAAQ